MTDFAMGRVPEGLRKALCETSVEYKLTELPDSPQNLTEDKLARLNSAKRISEYLLQLHTTNEAIQSCKNVYEDLGLVA